MLAQIPEVSNVVADFRSFVVCNRDINQSLLKKSVSEKEGLLTYHQTFKHSVVSFVTSIQECIFKDIESLFPITLFTELIRLL